MQVTIIGNGNMARGIGSRVLAGGHKLLILGRDASRAKALAAELSKGKFSALPAEGAELKAEAVKGEFIVPAVSYLTAVDLVRQIYPALDGKILVDISNPLNQTYDGLSLPADTSAAEEIAKIAGKDKTVVKAFNTVFASTLVEGKIAGQPIDIFIAGDDLNAKSLLSKLISDGGMNPLDVGPLKLSRQLEQLALLNIMVQGPLGLGYKSAWKLLAPTQY